MADKFLVLILLFLAPALLWCQDETPAQTEETQFIQTLSWIGDEHVLRYEVIIEKEDEGEVLRKFTETSFIEVSLPPGVYQYDVIPYDVLGRPSSGLGWQPFVIFTARQPELENFSPRYFKLENDRTWTLVITGKRLNPKAEIYLLNLDNEDSLPITPLEAVIYNDGNNARLSFDSNQFVLGNYALHIINPGGLETSATGITVAPQKIKKGLLQFLFTVLASGLLMFVVAWQS